MTTSTCTIRYYVTRKIGSLQEQVLAEARGVPVIDASWFAVTPFLQKYAAMKPTVHLMPLDGDIQQLMRPVGEEPYSTLLRYYRAQGIKTKIVSFNPEQIPALMVYPRDAEFIIDTRRALDNDELPSALAGLVGDYMEKMPAQDDLNGTLYVNAACSLVQRLADVPGAQAGAQANREALLEVIYQVARLFAGRTLTPTDAAAAFGKAVKAMEGLLS